MAKHQITIRFSVDKAGRRRAHYWGLARRCTACRLYHGRANMEAADDQQCRSFGAAPGSDAYINCRSQLAAGRMAALGPVTCTRVGNTTACN